MRAKSMGKVLVEAKVENLEDVLLERRKLLKRAKPRSVVVKQALVDTGAWNLCLPTSLITKLGLPRVTTKQMRGTTGTRAAGVYGPVRLTIKDRFCTVDVLEVTDDCPVLIGQIPLEAMDWVVDPQRGRLIGNPEHGGDWIIDAFLACRGLNRRK